MLPKIRIFYVNLHPECSANESIMSPWLSSVKRKRPKDKPEANISSTESFRPLKASKLMIANYHQKSITEYFSQPLKDSNNEISKPKEPSIKAKLPLIEQTVNCGTKPRNAETTSDYEILKTLSTAEPEVDKTTNVCEHVQETFVENPKTIPEKLIEVKTNSNEHADISSTSVIIPIDNEEHSSTEMGQLPTEVNSQQPPLKDTLDLYTVPLVPFTPLTPFGSELQLETPPFANESEPEPEPLPESTGSCDTFASLKLDSQVKSVQSFVPLTMCSDFTLNTQK